MKPLVFLCFAISIAVAAPAMADCVPGTTVHGKCTQEPPAPGKPNFPKRPPNDPKITPAPPKDPPKKDPPKKDPPKTDPPKKK